MSQKHSIWSVLCHYVAGWHKHSLLAWCTALCLGVALAGCAGSAVVAPVSKHAKTSRWAPVIHTVRRGETLYSIAFQYGQDYRRLASRNAIRSPYTIFVGQKLSLRGAKKAKSSRSSRKKVASSRSGSQKKAKKPVKKTSKATKKPVKKPHKQAKKPHKQAVSRGPVRWHWPTTGKIVETYSSKSATRKGIDIAGRPGQFVKAAAAGRVVYSGSGLRGYGRLIIVKHNERFLSAYAHNRKLLVKEGQQVKAGQKIAEMGRTGADRVKLHFEIRREGNPVNPLRYLPKRRS